MVKKQNLELPTVIGVDDTRANIDEVLYRETRAGSNTSVGTSGDGDGDVSVNKSAAVSGNDGVLGTGEFGGGS